MQKLVTNPKGKQNKKKYQEKCRSINAISIMHNAHDFYGLQSSNMI